MNLYTIEENDGLFRLQSPLGHEVRIAPQAGFNAYSFRIPHHDEQLRVLVEPESDEQMRDGGFSFGYPILFPFANRIRGGKYRFEGEEYQLDINFKDGNAIHGLVCNRAWQVVGQGADEKSAWISARFDTRLHPEVLRQYPFEMILETTYRLCENALNSEIEIVNVGDKNAPLSFGIHPWFPLPFTAHGQRSECTLQLPADKRWELEAQAGTSTQLLPTGRILPVDEKYDFRHEKALGDIFLDDVWTDLHFDNDKHICTVSDPESKLQLCVESSPSASFREYVVYAPLDRNVICLEPYSSTTNAPELQLAGFDAGLVILAPQQRWNANIRISVKSL